MTAEEYAVRIEPLNGPQTEAMKALRDDRWDLMPWGAMGYVARVYGMGAKKYAERDWEKGMTWGKSFRALISHATKAWRGEWLDPESGLPHLAHVVWHCLALMTYHDHHLGTDDRSPLAQMTAPAASRTQDLGEGGT